METKTNSIDQLLAPLKAGKIILPADCSVPTHHDHHSFTTVRDFTHRGKKVEIHTTYHILVDGEPLQAHTSVNHDGTVHNHSLPQYSFSSAVAMVRKLIDAFTVDLPHDELGSQATHTHTEE